MESEPTTPFAWQPLTPSGVAAFADASLRRLWLVQLLFAIFAMVVVLWLVHANWFPVISAAIRQMPARGAVQSGRLSWMGETPVRLAENHFLSLSVDLRHEGRARSPAHVQVEFGERDVVLLSLFGVVQAPYPRGYIIAFNRDELEPWWGAWSPPILAVTALSVIAGLMLCWGALALLYAPMAWLLGFFSDRELSLRGSYSACGAALMPGALFITVALALYGLGILDVLLLLIAGAAHLVTGWVYVALAPFWRPRIQYASGHSTNPFGIKQKERPPVAP